MALAASGLFGLLCVCGGSQLRAQAPAGPMTPKPNADEPAEPAPSAPARARRPAAAEPQAKPAPRQDIGGSWNFDRSASDNPRQKLEQARRGESPSGNGPIGGGNGPYGGGPLGGGYPPFPGNGPYGGGPYGGNGPFGGRQAPRGGYGDESDESPAMREYIEPAGEVTFILKGSEVDLTDDTARKRVFFTDGRKLQKPKDENYREIAAHWEGRRLVAEEKLEKGGRVRRVFELSSDGRQLNEEVDLEAARARGAVTLRFVYNINTSRE